MAASAPGFLARGFGRLWRLLDGTRRLLLNLLFLALLVALAWAYFAQRPKPLQERTALVLQLRGPLVEQFSGSWSDTALGRLRSRSPRQVQLRDVLDVLHAASRDPQIGQVLLALDDFEGAGPASLRELAAAVQRVKAAGKPVLAWGSGYDQRQYQVAAAASEVWLDPMGRVHLQGYGRLRSYYGDALDRLGVTVHLKRAGRYKSFGEPFTRSGPSPEATEAETALNQGLWRGYTDAVEAARRLEPGSLARGIDELPQRLAAAGGDLAQLALQSRLVDALKTRDELRRALAERGAPDEATKSFRQVGFEQYLARIDRPRGGEAVAVVVAEGEISDGEAPPGRIGGLSTAALIRKAREDELVKAVVLRVDSPGGSAFGAELIRRELELTRAAGKPVVVSMGDLAASGGYWVATAADEVIADAATVTGSIGVFTLLPTAEQALERLGVQSAGVTTTWLGAAYDLRRGLDPRFGALVQSSVDHLYGQFLAKVAGARKLTTAQADAAAQGRVWTGEQALQRGLVDRLGSYGDALAAAARRGGVAGADSGEFRVSYFERRPGRLQQLLDMAGDNLRDRLGASNPGLEVLREGQRELLWAAGLTQGRQPFAHVAHCLCVDP